MSGNIEPSPLDHLASVGVDGKHLRIHPTEVDGPWVRWRTRIWSGFFLIWASLPWISINGNPALLFDVPRRQFFVLGERFGPEDVWLVFFLITGLGFGLFMISALAGRLWCGYACPQTVMQELLFRRLEGMVEGKAAVRRRRDRKGWRNWSRKDWRIKITKWVLFVLLASFVGHTALAYFVPVREVLAMVSGSPAAHPVAFGWTVVITAVATFHFLSFREQLCLAICPYGRLQSALTDEDTIVVGYDRNRGEPRGAKRDGSHGDCVDCKLCVKVCPTGIDIRNGLQMECLGCMACIDACDGIMTKLGQPKGLVRLDSQRSLVSGQRRIWRPRLAIYGIALIAGLSAATFAASRSNGLSSHLSRNQSMVFEVHDDRIENRFLLRLQNRRGHEIGVEVARVPSSPGKLVLPLSAVKLAAGQELKLPVLVQAARDEVGLKVLMEVRSEGRVKQFELPVLGPSQ